ncbi:glycoside hydrolase family 3 N-terminal domain-containing protein [Eisenbergiella massiliensis]|uniref:glycoside hydrolase family 3 N-terminal domain-containing protein n=1 Tax=Eisenbergiella massiliensis TaxID=1720294 RepID=UPI002492AA50|nr:glycoside hydrolase family 3 N-terminal domain-containing protein [Eisenbergiella massiliensis]
MGEVSTLEMRRMETLEEAAAWQRKVQEIVMANSEHHIPAIFHMEGLCGAFIQDATSFPSGIGRASSFDTGLEEKIAEIVSRQEAACGITHVLAPVLDISRDSRMGRQGETYGEDPVLASAMGTAYTRGIQKGETAGRRTESVAKHFLAFHNSEGGIHGANSMTPERTLEEIYGKPFQAAITESNLRGIMPCYCTLNGEPVSASRTILTKLLREEMGFDGLCISDYGAIGNVHNCQHVGETAEEAGLLCMEAGMDVEMPNPAGYNDKLAAQFAKGEADTALLDRAVLRVLTAKFRMGLFEHPFALQGEELRKAFSHEKDREVSLQSAKESMVLLKNEGVLPISRDTKKIALIGPHADCARKFFGGYTQMCMMESTYAVANSIAGVSGSENVDNKKIITVPGTNIQSDETEEFDEILKRQKPGCRSLLEELHEKMPDAEIIYAYGYPIAGTDTSRFAEALEAVRKADVVILTLGGKHGTCSMASMGEGVDGADINLPECQDAFIRLAAELGKPMIGVHFNGRPVSSDAADRYLDAILEAWNPSEAGAEAVVSVLLGDYNPGGKMPVTTAYHAGQLPVYYNHFHNSSWHQTGSIGFLNYVDLPHTPRYYFGHGLSYTTFAYSELQISSDEVAPFEKLTISLKVENTGDRAGDEVVQLYLHDAFASMARPVRELAGFLRVGLEPGEKKIVIFTVEPSQMAFLDKDMRWKIEKGKIEVEIGSSSDDIRLTGSYEVTENGWIAGKDRAFYAKAAVE